MDEIRKTRETQEKTGKNTRKQGKNTKTGKNPQAHLFKYHTNEYMKGPNRYEKNMTINIQGFQNLCSRARSARIYELLVQKSDFCTLSKFSVF